jgi:hypothetical protein
MIGEDVKMENMAFLIENLTGAKDPFEMWSHFRWSKGKKARISSGLSDSFFYLLFPS